jgi:hypothetical protein
MNGNWLMIEQKIRSDMPFPIPLWVINSPIHITKAVPAVIVKMMRVTRPGL